MTLFQFRLVCVAAVLLLAFGPVLLSPFSITLLNFIGIYGLAVLGLKAFVGAIIGAMASYPLTALGAVLVGLLESFASFWLSAFKEVLVFGLLIPVLLWRSLGFATTEEEEAEE